MILDTKKFYGSKIEKILMGRGCTYQAKLSLLLYMLNNPDDCHPLQVAKLLGCRKSDFIKELLGDLEAGGYATKKENGFYDIQTLLDALAPSNPHSLVDLSAEEEAELRKICGKNYLQALNAAESYIMSLKADGKPVRITGYAAVYKAFAGRWWERDECTQSQKTAKTVPVDVPTGGEVETIIEFLQETGLLKEKDGAYDITYEGASQVFYTKRQIYEFIAENMDYYIKIRQEQESDEPLF